MECNFEDFFIIIYFLLVLFGINIHTEEKTNFKGYIINFNHLKHCA